MSIANRSTVQGGANGTTPGGSNGVNGAAPDPFEETVELVPFNLAAEESVIGSVLIDGDALHRIRGRLDSWDFFTDKCRVIYDAMLALADRGLAIDQVSVAYQLDTTPGLLESVGGTFYLSELVRHVPTSTHIEHYAGIVQQLAIDRAGVQLGKDLVNDGYGVGLADTMRRLDDYRDKVARKNESVASAPEVSHAILEWLKKGDDSAERISTGFEYLDGHLGGGFKRGELVILAGMPGTGKSALGIQFATHAAQSGAGVFFASLEMSAEELGKRAISNESRIGSGDLMRQWHNTDTQKHVTDIQNAAIWYSELDLSIDDRGAATAADVVAAAQGHHPAPDMVIVDHLQLLATDDRLTRNDGLDRATRALRGLARDLDCVVLVLSQLNRTGQSEKYAPKLSHLRDSGAIEQNSDVVAFLHDIDPEKVPEDWRTEIQTKLRLTLAKNRNGRAGDDAYQAMAFHKPTSRFTAWELTYTTA